MFEIRVNGEKVHETDQQVTGVAIQSARGELYRAGISTEGVIDIRLDVVRAGDPPRLDQLEALQRLERSARVQGERSGSPELESDRSKAAQQEIGVSTLMPGSDAENAINPPPGSEPESNQEVGGSFDNLGTPPQGDPTVNEGGVVDEGEPQPSVEGDNNPETFTGPGSTDTEPSISLEEPKAEAPTPEEPKPNKTTKK
jgi:hypothetical protein